MKQVILHIPDTIYQSFIAHIKRKFTTIQIQEKTIVPEKFEVAEEGTTYETTLLSEQSLAEDWLSDEDNRWDNVL
ncbi:MAG: hypothetical protein KDD04_11385 [Sinomicrobium sp.]|nr:hypothetical protein [Sinomicrobium sp.]